jgi:hypothetical protein
MDYIYNKKYQKYKQKYLLLKQLILEGGGDHKFIGQGAFGCVFCPPINFLNINIIEGFPYYNSSFQNYNNCEYIGKILSIGVLSSDGRYTQDSYQSELQQIEKIKKLDPNGDYTPELIHANVYNYEVLFNNPYLNNFNNYINVENCHKLIECLKKKIKINKFGYIISKNTGKTLESKYNSITPENNIENLKNFLKNFCILLQFIKILYDNNYLHLDIKMDNITIKEDGKLYLIDFGRFTKIDNTNYRNIIRILRTNHDMYSFEPKIYSSLMSKSKPNQSLKDLKEIVKENVKEEKFDKFIQPYKIIPSSFLYTIFTKVFETDVLSSMSEDIFLNKIKEYQKEYFTEHLENNNTIQRLDEIIEREKINKTKNQRMVSLNPSEKSYVIKHQDDKKVEEKEIEVSSLLEAVFYPIIKKYDLYCMGIVLAQVVLNCHTGYNKNFKDQFINLIKKLLFNKFDEVDDIINEINELIKLI